MAYACLSAGQSADSPLVAPMITKVLAKFSADGYAPTLHHSYEAGVDAMALAAATNRSIETSWNSLRTSDQKSENEWVVGLCRNGPRGDTSISQYGNVGALGSLSSGG